MNQALLNVCLLVVVGLVSGDDVQQLSSASSAFSQRPYQQITLPIPNATYSPFSIHAALCMASLGARGDTATEIFHTLGLTSLQGDCAHQAYHDLIVQLNDAKDVKLHTANALFVNSNFPIKSQFINDAKTNYLASCFKFDPAAVGGPEKAINDFVENKTEGLIRNIFPPGSVNALTAIVLVNTIVFNGTWETKFPIYKTQKQDFQQLGGVKSQVDMMSDVRDVNIKTNVNGVDVIELPFAGGQFSLYLALPQKVDGVTDFEKSLVIPGAVDRLFEGLTLSRVNISIPKFKIESTFQPNAALKQLGLMIVLEHGYASFQGISSAADVYIPNMFHKAVIEVNETGTVAAAASSVIVEGKAAIDPLPIKIEFNQPFIVFLRDKRTGHTLFQVKFSG